MADETPKNPGGRPKWMPTAEQIRIAEGMAARGLTYEEIARNLGISVDTLLERRKEFSEFSDAIQKGRAAGIAMMASVVYDMARDPKVPTDLRLGAAQFFLDRRDEWNGKIDLRISLEPSRLKAIACWSFTPARPVYPAVSLRDFLSGALRGPNVERYAPAYLL